MEGDGDFNRQLAAAVRDMSGEPSTAETLQRAAVLATQLVENCDIAGVSIVHRTDIDTPAATDETLRMLDSAQFEAGEGPCLEVMRTEEIVTSNDLAQDPRWPRWAPKIAAEAGVRSCLCFRLFAHGDSLGALSLYSRRPNAFTGGDVDHGLALAAHVAVAVAATQAEDHLQLALDNRTVIAQATGILMERFDLTPDRAFAVLVRLSTNSNTKLRELAVKIVETRLIPG